MCVCVCVCVCVSVSVSVSVSVCGSLHCLNEIVPLLKLTLSIYNFFTWLLVMYCLFLIAVYEWNVTKTNSYA